MANPTTKTELLDAIRTEYDALMAALAPIDVARMTEPGVNGTWSIKDELAHLTFWQKRLLPILRTVAARGEPEYTPAVGSQEAIDHLNAQCYADNKGRPLDDILDDFQHTHRETLAAINALSEEDLFVAHRFAWNDGAPLWESIAGDTYDHYPEHTTQIQEWSAQSGRG